ncbi:MAG: GNAT family N-acetyltransferase [Planctomycetes bacterium]|nr:GNAT family N-acetyltransferase [Planctomycetota bacterium]
MRASPRNAGRVVLERPSLRREEEFLALAKASRALHRPWVTPPATPGEYRMFLARCRRRAHEGYLVVVRDTRALAGVVNLNEIVRGQFGSAYLGYYAFAPSAGKGFMTEGLALVLDRAFKTMRLHRLEANVQPGNEASLRLLRRLGFRREGFSPRYLKIGRRWRDHERWAVLAEEWAERRPAARSRKEARP